MSRHGLYASVGFLALTMGFGAIGGGAAFAQQAKGEDASQLQEVVVVARRTPEGGVAMEVRDAGSGMTPEEVEVAMEPFGQVDARLAREHEGTGLGLPLARRLTELHGGSLRIVSEKGCGTTVTVILPASRILSDSARLPAETHAGEVAAED